VAENPLPRLSSSPISNRQQHHASDRPPLPSFEFARPGLTPSKTMFRSTSSAARFTRQLPHPCRAFLHSSVVADATTAVPAIETSKPPYFIQRNSRGSIPVYTDIRNAGTRYLVLIRNVEGNVNVCPSSLSFPFFPLEPHPRAFFVIETLGKQPPLRISPPCVFRMNAGRVLCPSSWS